MQVDFYFKLIQLELYPSFGLYNSSPKVVIDTKTS
jgi:hypothetical protein